MKDFAESLALEIAAANVWNQACKHAGYDQQSKVFKIYARSIVLQWFVKTLVCINKLRLANLTKEQKQRREVIKQLCICFVYMALFLLFVWLLPDATEKQIQYDKNYSVRQMQIEAKYRANKNLHD